MSSPLLAVWMSLKNFLAVTINPQSTTAAAQTYTFIDRTTTVLNSVWVYKIGIYSTTARTFSMKIVKRNSLNNYDVVVNQSFAHGGTGFEDMTLTTPYLVPATGSYYLGAYCPAGGASPNVTANTARTYAGPAIDLTGTGVATTGEDAASSAYPQRYTYAY